MLSCTMDVTSRWAKSGGKNGPLNKILQGTKFIKARSLKNNFTEERKNEEVHPFRKGPDRLAQ